MFWYRIHIKAGESFIVPVNAAFSSAVYVLQGELKILNETVKSGQLAELEINGNQLAFTSVQDSSLIVFGGQPLKEKVVIYGPFVINSMEEVQQAIEDYEEGRMGVLGS